MKIVRKDPHSRPFFNEHIVCEEVKENYAFEICSFLNEELNANFTFIYTVEEDDYELKTYKGALI